MGEIIYWKKYDEPKKVYNPALQREVEVTGEYVCTDERVEKYWEYGSASRFPSDNSIIAYATMLFKNGDRWLSKPATIERIHSGIDVLIKEAEEYLKSLKQQ